MTPTLPTPGYYAPQDTILILGAVPQEIILVVAAMQDNLKQYEQKFGAIKTADQPEHKIGFRTE